MENNSVPGPLVPGGFVKPSSDSDSDCEHLQYSDVTNTERGLFSSSRDETDNGICVTSSPNATTDNDEHTETTTGVSRFEQRQVESSGLPNPVWHQPSLFASGNAVPTFPAGNTVPATPTKPNGEGDDPVTPTANLKILLSAASPDIRERDNRKKELFPDQSQWPFPMPEIPQPVLPKEMHELKEEQLSEEELFEDSSKPVSRKDKSLGLLCQRFLSQFPDYPDPNGDNDISLDVVARDLSVERRRIYDIVNVLESVEIVSRLAKNKYTWHGKGNLMNTLAKLKALGENENYAQQIVHLKKMQEEREFNFGEDTKPKKEPLKENEGDNVPWKFVNVKEAKGLEKYNNRKDKSLGVMSQKFIMLFLVSKTKVVSLDIAARILIGDINYEINENSKFKTKIRRLYDIANILTSLQLIKKVHVTESRGRKPAFKWVGPEPFSDQSSSNGSQRHTTEPVSSAVQRPPTKHSLLNQFAASYERSFDMKENNPSVGKSQSTNRQRVFSRHASFQSMCEVAEREHSKLCSSAPSSPTKEVSQEFDAKLRTEFESFKKSYPGNASHLFVRQNEEQVRKQPTDQTQKVDVQPQPGKVPLQPGCVGSHNKIASSLVNHGVGVLQTVKTQFSLLPNSTTGVPTQTIVTINGLRTVDLQSGAILNPAVASLQKSDGAPSRRSKRTIKQILSEDYEYQPVAKKKLLNAGVGAPTNSRPGQAEESGAGVDDSDGPEVFSETAPEVTASNHETVKPPLKLHSRRRSSLTSISKPSPLRALHHDPEFRSSPSVDSVSSNSSKTPSPVDGKFDANDLELAFPLNDENTKDETSQPLEETKQTDESVIIAEDGKNDQTESVSQLETDEAVKKDDSGSAESSQTSLLFSQSPFQLLLNSRNSFNSPNVSRPSSLSSIAELERVFSNCNSPPILSPGAGFPGQPFRSKSASPSHFHSLVGSHVQQMSMPTVISPPQSCTQGSPAVLSQLGGSNLPTPTLLSSSNSPAMMSPSLGSNSGGSSVFNFNLNQLLANAAKSQAVAVSQLQQQQCVPVPLPTTAIHTAIPNVPLTVAQTPSTAVPSSVMLTPRSQQPIFLQQNSFIQTPFAQWSTPISNRGNGGGLLPGMSPIMPSECFSPKTLTPGNTSYQNVTLTATPIHMATSSAETTPISSVDFNSSSFFHTPNVYPIISAASMMQSQQTAVPLSAFQQVSTNQIPPGVTASRRLVIPDAINNQSQT